MEKTFSWKSEIIIIYSQLEKIVISIESSIFNVYPKSGYAARV